MGRRILGGGRADEFLESGIAYSEEGGSEELTVCGEAIAVGFGDLLDDAVGAQKAQLAADLGGEGWSVVIGAFGWIEQRAQIAVSKAGSGKLAAGDSVEQGEVGRVADTQRPQTPSAVADAGTDLIEEVAQACGVVDGSESVEVGVVGALRDLSASVKVSDSLTQGLPGELVTARALEGTEDLEAGGFSHGRFDAQDASRLVVHLDGVAIGPVFDADAFLAALQARGELALEVVVNASTAEEAHDVGTVEVQHRVTDEVGAALPFELTGEPLPAVEPDLDVEGKPGLEPGAEEAEDGVKVVLVDVEALARPQTKTSFAWVRRAVVLEAHAGLDGAEGADQASLDRMLLEQSVGQSLFVGSGPLEVAHGPLLLDGLAQRSLPDAFTGRERIALEVEQAHSGVEQQPVHAALHDQRQQSPAEHQPVEAVQNGRDGGAETRYEFIHDGVLLEVAGLGRTTQIPREVAPSLLWVAGVSPR